MASAQKKIKDSAHTTDKQLIHQYSRKANRHQRFNLFFLGTIVSSLILVGTFNFLVDPYGIFGSPLIPKFNVYKVEKENYDRLYKVADIIHLQPKTVILGSSRAKRGIDPDYQGLKAEPPIYNLALNNSNIHELVEYFKYALKNQKDLHTVIIGLDLFMFNDYLKPAPTYSESRLTQNHLAWLDIINALFSIDSLSISQKTIASNSRSVSIPELLPNAKGFIPITKANDGRMMIKMEALLNHYFKLYPRYRLSEKYLEDLRQLVKISKENNIELKAFISPVHAIQLEADAKNYGWSAIEELKREIVKVTPVWDFSGYNGITGEPLAKNMNHYTDSSHYLPIVGDRVIDRIFDQPSKTIPADFGVLINADNIEDHLAKLRRDREQWKENQRRNQKDCHLCDKFF